MNFTELIASSHEYLSRFEYDFYPDCFREFQEKAAPFFDSLSEDNKEAFADTCLRDLEERCAGLSRRAAKDTAFRDKQVLALFFSPAAEKHSEKAFHFSALLRERWNRSHPGNTYLPGNYDAILKGFEANLLGLPLRKSRFNRR